jgi:hypothetical protein
LFGHGELDELGVGNFNRVLFEASHDAIELFIESLNIFGGLVGIIVKRERILVDRVRMTEFGSCLRSTSFKILLGVVERLIVVLLNLFFLGIFIHVFLIVGSRELRVIQVLCNVFFAIAVELVFDLERILVGGLVFVAPG